MKCVLTIILLHALVLCAYSQQLATSFQNAVAYKGISIDSLDRAYKSALHTDTTLAAFNGREQEFMQGYSAFLKAFANYLKTNDYKWGKVTRSFNRMYISKEGKIDFFLFQFRKDEITPQQEIQFEALLNIFIKEYKFPLTNTVAFAQCSPVQYSD